MEYVWYACYGSNLSSERFKCYIQGGICKENNKPYSGCTDKSLWLDSKIRRFPGKVFFGQSSPSWDYTGVAFYSPSADGETIMRLYKITSEQFTEVQRQEGRGDSWYGNKVDLGVDDDGCRIFTITNRIPIPSNNPSDKYLMLIKTALTEECGLSEKEMEEYIQRCLINH